MTTTVAEEGFFDTKTMFDDIYEFSAPGYYDFVIGETEEEKEKAELWFDTNLSYAPSPFMPKIKAARSLKINSLCDFNDAGAGAVVKSSSSDYSSIASDVTDAGIEAGHQIVPVDSRISIGKTCSSKLLYDEKQSVMAVKCTVTLEAEKLSEGITFPVASVIQDVDVCTPNFQPKYRKGYPLPPSLNKNETTAKRIASLIRNPSSLKAKTVSVLKTKTPSALNSKTQLSQNSSAIPAPLSSAVSTRKLVGGLDFAHENQAIKRQKLDDGTSRRILNVKPQTLPHKSKPGLTTGASNFSFSNNNALKEDRKLYARETSYVSNAEMIQRFQSGTRDTISRKEGNSTAQKRRKLTLTRPKEPAFETTNRVRSVRLKSSAEIEEEMMAKIPKFKARPVNKKILEASTLPALPRITPQRPEFQEFHLKTTERANKHEETSSVVSASESMYQSSWNPHKLTEPKTPRLETSLRARPPKGKTTQELELEEVEKFPRFKARPLNRKIFENKGGHGMFCNTKRHVTKPQEFHFATDERISASSKTVFDLFDKLSINSDIRHDLQLPRLTTPNPFHLYTEERGAEKERKLMEEILQKQLEEEKARIPKATPYPYTTDYPVVPPKPEPKECTKPEPFELESLVRHEEEMQREMEERKRFEKEEAQMRIFRAQPILKEDPLPVPEKARIPLTQVEEFPLHVDHRAAERAEFDNKIKEKEITYKRYRDENESAKLMEEEKALKQLRRTMVPHARPLPKFDNPFHPRRSSKETTKPKSPKLCSIQRKKMRMVGNRTSSASASQMR